MTTKTTEILAGRAKEPGHIHLTGWKHVDTNGTYTETEMITGFTFTPDPYPGQASVVDPFVVLTPAAAERLLWGLIDAGVPFDPNQKPGMTLDEIVAQLEEHRRLSGDK